MLCTSDHLSSAPCKKYMSRRVCVLRVPIKCSLKTVSCLWCTPSLSSPCCRRGLELEFGSLRFPELSSCSHRRCRSGWWRFVVTSPIRQIVEGLHLNAVLKIDLMSQEHHLRNKGLWRLSLVRGRSFIGVVPLRAMSQLCFRIIRRHCWADPAPQTVNAQTASAD